MSPLLQDTCAVSNYLQRAQSVIQLQARQWYGCYLRCQASDQVARQSTQTVIVAMLMLGLGLAAVLVDYTSILSVHAQRPGGRTHSTI